MGFHLLSDSNFGVECVSEAGMASDSTFGGESVVSESTFGVESVSEAGAGVVAVDLRSSDKRWHSRCKSASISRTIFSVMLRM